MSNYKSFISILGTNNYLDCRHSFKELITDKPVKYCQEDIIKLFCQNYDNNFEIRIFLTEEAERKNWFNDGHYKNNQVIKNIGLKERLENLYNPNIIKPIRIKEGYTEKEIWENFQIIYDTFREGEEVIVDITHSFRSLPLLMITLLNFAKQVKRIKVSGIYYAAFETLGPIPEVEKIPPEKRIAPILDLTSFADLQDWTNATYDFVNYGNVKKFKSLITPEKIVHQNRDLKEEYYPRRVIDKLNELIENIALCRGKELLDFNYDELKTGINKLKESKMPKPFYYLIQNIYEKINSFNNNSLELILALASWCYTHGLYQQAITLLQEFSITIILKNKQLDYTDKEKRNIVSQAFRIYAENIPEPHWFELASNNKELVKQLFEDNIFKNLVSDYNSLTELRNDVNHAGFVQPRAYSKIKGKLERIIISYKDKLNLI